jgi:hypothetical protein
MLTVMMKDAYCNDGRIHRFSRVACYHRESRIRKVNCSPSLWIVLQKVFVGSLSNRLILVLFVIIDVLFCFVDGPDCLPTSVIRDFNPVVRTYETMQILW